MTSGFLIYKGAEEKALRGLVYCIKISCAMGEVSR